MISSWLVAGGSALLKWNEPIALRFSEVDGALGIFLAVILGWNQLAQLPRLRRRSHEEPLTFRFF